MFPNDLDLGANLCASQFKALTSPLPLATHGHLPVVCALEVGNLNLAWKQWNISVLFHI